MSHDIYLRRIIITFDVEHDAALEITAAGALIELINWLHHHDISAAWTSLEITGDTLTIQPTP